MPDTAKEAREMLAAGLRSRGYSLWASILQSGGICEAIPSGLFLEVLEKALARSAEGWRDERAAVVAWLRALPAGNSDWCADVIERGDHIQDSGAKHG